MFLLTAHAEEFGVSRRTPAQPQQPSQQILPYVVRVIAFDSDGQSFGTGSYVGTYGEYGVILTNWHVICETEGLVHVHFPLDFSSFGFSSFGAVVKSDRIWDLALIAISKPPLSIPTLPVSQTASKPGDPLWIAGFGSGAYRIVEGRCVRYLAPDPKDGSTLPSEIMEVSVSARKGDSGGPILNQKGELAGVLFGSDMIRNTAGSYCERVNRFLMETQSEMARLPSRPETHFATMEKNGPLHELRDSRNMVPQNTQNTTIPQQRIDGFSPPVSSPGTRSSSRRYAPPGNGLQRLQLQLQTPQQGQESPAMIKMPLMSLTPPTGIAQATWAESAPKFGRSVQPAKVAQTAHLTPLTEISTPIGLSTASHSVADRYLLKVSMDRSDLFFSLFMLFNACLATGLTYLAVRLLRS